MINTMNNEHAAVTRYASVSNQNARPSPLKNSEHLQSIATLMNSEERLRLIEDNVRDFAIIVLDIEGCIVAWNTGAERILGYMRMRRWDAPLPSFLRPKTRRGTRLPVS